MDTKERDILKTYLEVCAEKKEYTIQEIYDTGAWIEGIEPAIRQKKMPDLAQIYAMKLIGLREWNDVISDEVFIAHLASMVDLIAVTDIEEKDSRAYIACFRFLRKLKDKENVCQQSSELVSEYKLFMDILPKIEGIFLLQNEEGEKVFPIYELIIGMAKEFQYDDMHLMHLAIAHQMFEKIGVFSDMQGEEIKREIMQIAETHEIAFLSCLANNGELIFDEENYKRNGTLMAYNDTQIIIRNVRKSYFSQFDSQAVKQESGGLAWYVCDILAPDEELVDFKEIINGTDYLEKWNLLKEVQEKKAYNVFLEKMIVRKKLSREFLRFSNSCISKDNYIVCLDRVEAASESAFFKILKDNNQGMRASALYEDGAEILTVDFYCAFFLHIVKECGPFFTDMKKKEAFIQGHLVKQFFLQLYEKKKTNALISAIEDYALFLKKFFDYKNYEANVPMDKELLAYPCIAGFPKEVSFRNIAELLKNEILDSEHEQGEFAEIIYDNEERVWKIGGKSVDGVTWYDIEGEIKEQPGKTKRNITIYGYFCAAEKKLIIDERLPVIKRNLEIILDCEEDEVIEYVNWNKYDKNKIKRLCDIMEANVLRHDVFEMYECVSEEQRKNVLLYKILWHFQIWQISHSLIEDFWKLVFDKHYIQSIENKEAIKQYFDKMHELAEQEGTLVIAKEGSGGETTLSYLYDNFGKKPGERKVLSQAFDLSYINMNLKKAGSKYLWKNKPISKIVFMADNMMNGGSLRKLLDAQLKGATPKRQYIMPSCEIRNILKDNPKIEVEVHIIFGYTEKKADIERDYSVKVYIHEKIDQEYIADQETVVLVRKLYQYNASKGVHCIFRYHNLPSKNVFPEVVIESINRVGLFQREGEME